MKIHPDSYINELKKLYQQIDAHIGQHYQAHPSKALLQPCKKGCSFCCSQFFEISEGEAMYILSYLEGATTEQKNYYKEMISRTYQHFQKEYSDFYQKYFAHSNEEPFDEEAYFEEELRYEIRIPCPFLNSEGACSIYEYRPLICRTTGSSFTTADDVGEICELIPSSLKAQLWQANLQSFEEEIWKASELTSFTSSEEILVLRQYPLFYWLYELFCEAQNDKDVFSNPLYRSYFEKPRKELEQELYEKLIL